MHELLAAYLRPEAEEHRHHRQGHARRPGQRAELVAVERPIGWHGCLWLEGGHARPDCRLARSSSTWRKPVFRWSSACSARLAACARRSFSPMTARTCSSKACACATRRCGTSIRCSARTSRSAASTCGHGPNNDGVDPESWTTCLIENCSFNTGDDCIAINSGRNADGRRIARRRRISWSATAA